MEILAARMLVRPVNPARTLSFYRDVLQLAVYREFPGGTVFFLGGGYLEVSGQATAAEAKSAAASQRSSASEEQTAPSPSDAAPDERIRLWIQVRDLATAYRTLLDRGATVVRPPRWEPWGLNEMWVADPDGLQIGIHCAATPAADRQAAQPLRPPQHRRRWRPGTPHSYTRALVAVSAARTSARSGPRPAPTSPPTPIAAAHIGVG